MKSRDNKALKWDDLLAENFALQNQRDEITDTLSAIERDCSYLTASCCLWTYWFSIMFSTSYSYRDLSGTI